MITRSYEVLALYVNNSTDEGDNIAAKMRWECTFSKGEHSTIAAGDAYLFKNANPHPAEIAITDMTDEQLIAWMLSSQGGEEFIDSLQSEHEWFLQEQEYAGNLQRVFGPSDDPFDFTGFSPEMVIHRVTELVQQRLDEFAQTSNYDGILSACTYATSTVPKFATEGQYCVNVRDATWAALYAYMDEVESGFKTMPANYAEVEALLPTLAWPA